MSKIIHIAWMLAYGAIIPASATSPWLERVYDFRPAPGEFVNQLPEYEAGDTEVSMLEKVREQLCSDRMPGAVSLGAFGGYVTVGFDHPVVNVPGEYDFKIFGNAIISDSSRRGGSAEPGVVWVSEDVNANGLPDDPWYELAGSEYTNPHTRRRVTITYYRPDPDKAPTADPASPAIVDATYVRYTTDAPSKPEGYVPRVKFHTQPYWPQWLGREETLQFSGTLLPDNFIDTGTADSPYYVQLCYDYGYADNLPNAQDPGFDISHAVDSEGNPVHLNGIHFIRIHTGVCQFCGWLGETSTEVCGGEDLHPEEIYIPGAVGEVSATRGNTLCQTPHGLSFTCVHPCTLQILTHSGVAVMSETFGQGTHTIATDHLPTGLYIAAAPGATLRFHQ